MPNKCRPHTVDANRPRRIKNLTTSVEAFLDHCADACERKVRANYDRLYFVLIDERRKIFDRAEITVGLRTLGRDIPSHAVVATGRGNRFLKRPRG